MRVTLQVLLSLVWIGEAVAQGVTVERVEILRTGIFTAAAKTTQPAPGTASGTRHIVTGATLLQATTRIPAKVGVHFGMQFRLFGQPDKASVRLISITHYPAPGLKNPTGGGPQLRGEHTLSATVGTVNYRGYLFEHEWELVPGSWTFELWDGKRMLAKQTFQVVRP